MADPLQGIVVAETDRIMAELLEAAAAPGTGMQYMASDVADGLADQFPDTPGLGLIIVAAVTAAADIWHACQPDHDHADPLQVIAILGHAAAELQRREQEASSG